MGKSKLANAICCPILLRSYLIFYSIFLLSRALLHISALGECVFAFVFLCLPNELSIDCQIIKQKRSVGKASRGGSLSLENENCLLCRQQHCNSRLTGSMGRGWYQIEPLQLQNYAKHYTTRIADKTFSKDPQ